MLSDLDRCAGCYGEEVSNRLENFAANPSVSTELTEAVDLRHPSDLASVIRCPFNLSSGPEVATEHRQTVDDPDGSRHGAAPRAHRTTLRHLLYSRSSSPADSNVSARTGLVSAIMRGGTTPTIRQVKTGKVLAEQDTDGNELYLLLNGVLVVEVDGEQLAEVGPGAVLGERAALEGGVRIATLRAVTDCKVAAAPAVAVDQHALIELADEHRREEAPA